MNFPSNYELLSAFYYSKKYTLLKCKALDYYLFSSFQYCHVYNGCIICEVRSYRVPYLLPAGEDTLNYESQLILLKPSPEVRKFLESSL